MDLIACLRSEIAACDRLLHKLDFALRVDRGYVASEEADPADVEYFRCRVELEALERRYLEDRLRVLNRWLGAGGTPGNDGGASVDPSGLPPTNGAGGIRGLAF